MFMLLSEPVKMKKLVNLPEHLSTETLLQHFLHFMSVLHRELIPEAYLSNC